MSPLTEPPTDFKCPVCGNRQWNNIRREGALAAVDPETGQASLEQKLRLHISNCTRCGYVMTFRSLNGV